MSALGHKQACAVQNSMSAIPPKVDMCSALGDVCFVPEADIQRRFYSMPSSTNSMVVLKLMTSSAQSGLYSHFFHLKNR